MKRRVWLGLALVGCVTPFAGVTAQDSRVVPPTSEVKPPSVKAEPATKPQVKQEGGALTVEPTPATTSDGVLVEEPSLSDRLGGFREALFRPWSFSWFDEFTGANNQLMTSDVEDPYWFRMELLFARFKDANTPPLLTTSLPQSSTWKLTSASRLSAACGCNLHKRGALKLATSMFSTKAISSACSHRVIHSWLTPILIP